LAPRIYGFIEAAGPPLVPTARRLVAFAAFIGLLGFGSSITDYETASESATGISEGTLFVLDLVDLRARERA